MNPIKKLLTISVSCAALIACTTGFAGEANSGRSFNYIQDSSDQDIEKRDEERSERRRERRMERRERNRNRGNAIYISSDNHHDFWDGDTDEDGKISREEFREMEDRDEDDADKTFDKIDENGDDYIEEEELDDFIDETVEKAMIGVDKAMEAIGDMDFDFDFDFDFGSDDDHSYSYSYDYDDDDDDHEDRYERRHTYKMERGVERSVEKAMRGASRALEQAGRRMERSQRRMERFEFDEEEMEERMVEHRERMLKRLDKDENGTVSRDEFTSKNDRTFDRLDDNDDGVLSSEELSKGSLGPIMMQLGNLDHMPAIVDLRRGGKGFKIIERKRFSDDEEKKRENKEDN